MSDDYFVLTIQDVADVLRVSKTHVSRLIEQGKLDAFRVGRAVRIRPDVVNEYVGYRIFKVPGPISKTALEKNRDKQRARQRALRKLADKAGGAFEDLLDEEYEREGYERQEPPSLSDDWRL